GPPGGFFFFPPAAGPLGGGRPPGPARAAAPPKAAPSPRSGRPSQTGGGVGSPAGGPPAAPLGPFSPNRGQGRANGREEGGRAAYEFRPTPHRPALRACQGRTPEATRRAAAWLGRRRQRSHRLGAGAGTRPARSGVPFARRAVPVRCRVRAAVVLARRSRP